MQCNMLHVSYALNIAVLQSVKIKVQTKFIWFSNWRLEVNYLIEYCELMGNLLMKLKLLDQLNRFWKDFDIFTILE